jgi:carbon monoxide dehydrogenase subunit G
MKIESNKVYVSAKPEAVASFLLDARNLIHLLPEDKISDWKSSETECSFKVQGGVIISLIQDGAEGFSRINMRSGAGTPFPFHLSILIEPKEDGCEGYILFDGEVNVFLRMMVEKPLTALFNFMSDKLQSHFTA